MAKLADAVTEGPGGWNFACPVADGTCGDAGVPFTSSGWPTKKVATARGQEHLEDHDGTPMPDLDDFRGRHGLNPDGSPA